MKCKSLRLWFADNHLPLDRRTRVLHWSIVVSPLQVCHECSTELHPGLQDVSWNAGKKFMGNVDAFLKSLQTFAKDNLTRWRRSTPPTPTSSRSTFAASPALRPACVAGSSTSANTSASIRCLTNPAQQPCMVRATVSISTVQDEQCFWSGMPLPCDCKQLP